VEIGSGSRGPITERLQSEFFAIIHGSKADLHGWLTPVYAHQPVAVNR
jgi:branched-chain amino acid aminotransferase